MIGSRAIGGYPLDAVRKLLDGAQSFATRFDAVIAQTEAVEMTPDVVARLVKQGRWSEEELLEMKADGFRYSPGRDSLMGPIMSSDDDDSE